MGILDGVPVYELFERVSDYGTLEKVNYFFISEGERFVIKVVEFTYIGVLRGRPVYNFGFGDLDEFSDSVTDGINTENGDVYKVFHTVLSTVPLFFEKTPNAIIRISGSDNGFQFEKGCRKSCRKNCTSICKNRNRRIRIYRGFILKHFRELNLHFEFWESNSVNPGEEKKIIPFGKGELAVSIYVKKRNSLI